MILNLLLPLVALGSVLFRSDPAADGAVLERRLLHDGWHGVVTRADGTWIDLGHDFHPAGWTDDGRARGLVLVENGHDVESMTPVIADLSGKRETWADAPAPERLLGKLRESAAAMAAASPPWIVAVDPGHGGPGAGMWNGVNGDGAGSAGPGGLTEQWVNLRVAGFLLEFLAADPNFEGSFLTRTAGAQFVSLADRVALAAQAGASLFVSIHHNGLPPGVANRTETYYCARNPGCTNLAAWKAPAVFGHDEIVAAFGYGARGALEDSAGSGRFHFYVLRNSAMPSFLAEASNLNADAAEEALFGLDPAETHGRDEARALYRAILRTFALPVSGAGNRSGSEGAAFAFGPPTAAPGGGWQVGYESMIGAPLQAAVHDVAGRLVRRLDPPGAAAGTLFWNGRSSTGRPAGAGHYWLSVSRAGEILGSVRLTLVP